MDPSNNPSALECVSSILSSLPQVVTIGPHDVTFGATATSLTTVNGRLLGVAAYPGLKGTWASFAGSTGSIRTSPTILQCYSFQVTGSGNDRKLTIGWLGGTGYSVSQQCSPTAIALSPTAFTNPYCASLPGSLSPYQSVILGEYVYAGASSGAASTTFALLAMLATVLASTLLL